MWLVSDIIRLFVQQTVFHLVFSSESVKSWWLYAASQRSASSHRVTRHVLQIITTWKHVCCWVLLFKGRLSLRVPQVQGHRQPDGHPDVQRRVLDVSEGGLYLAAVRPAGRPGGHFLSSRLHAGKTRLTLQLSYYTWSHITQVSPAHAVTRLTWPPDLCRPSRPADGSSPSRQAAINWSRVRFMIDSCEHSAPQSVLWSSLMWCYLSSLLSCCHYVHFTSSLASSPSSLLFSSLLKSFISSFLFFLLSLPLHAPLNPSPLSLFHLLVSFSFISSPLSSIVPSFPFLVSNTCFLLYISCLCFLFSHHFLSFFLSPLVTLFMFPLPFSSLLHVFFPLFILPLLFTSSFSSSILFYFITTSTFDHI